MNPVRVGVIDYGRGNLRSVEKALLSQGAETVRLTGPEEVEKCAALVLPGVGAFGDCVRSLRSRELEVPLREWILADRPFLGICLGYQMLFESSEESPEETGLAIFSGRVKRFPSGLVPKIPHMGWNQLSLTTPAPVLSPLYADISEGSYVYFVHSYHPCPTDETLVTAWCDYGRPFAASIGRGRVQAVQFHPEKSQEVGLHLLRNFLATVRG